MGKRIVKAKDLKIGDILDKTVAHGVMSIHGIQKRRNALGGEEIFVTGPLKITEKFHPNKMVTILI